MRFLNLSCLAAIGLAVGLSACASHPPLVSQASFIDRVDVRLDPSVTSPTIAAIVAGKTRAESTRYGRAGAPKHLEITVTRLHYKNALQSLLIGDANGLAARVSVLDSASNTPHGMFETVATDTAALNGVSGVLISVMQDKAQVDQRLGQQLASKVLEQVYGTEVAKVARQRPMMPVEEPAPVVPAPAAPAKPAPAPVKMKEPKTASAEAALVR